jgi:hypothetical protein
MTTVHYTAHYNWDWVVSGAVESLRAEINANEAVRHHTFRDLPSCKAAVGKVKAIYALFRLDITNSDQIVTHMVRTRSDMFGFLDPKDSLARICLLMSASQFMPESILIPWNWTNGGPEDPLAVQIRASLKVGPKLLKAPLGSGGFGLYFVYSVHGETLHTVQSTRKVSSDYKFAFSRCGAAGDKSSPSRTRTGRVYGGSV